MSKNENNIVSDLELREGNDNHVEGVEVQKELEEAEIASKGTKNDMETIVKYLTFVYFSLSFVNTSILC